MGHTCGPTIGRSPLCRTPSSGFNGSRRIAPSKRAAAGARTALAALMTRAGGRSRGRARGARAERMARQAAATRLAAIVEGSDDAIVGNNLDGIIASWNPASERIFGYRAAEVVGR